MSVVEVLRAPLDAAGNRILGTVPAAPGDVTYVDPSVLGGASLLAAAADHVHPGIGEISMSRKAPAMNVLIPAGYGAYVPRSLEVSSGVAVEVGVGATLEIG